VESRRPQNSVFNKKPDIPAKWYLWSFPIYVLGVVLVGLALRVAAPSAETCLLLLPLWYLVHFFVGVASGRTARPAGDAVEDAPEAPIPAQLFINAVLAGGLAMLGVAISAWDVADDRRFLAYLALSMLTATCKVRLPGMTSTLSLNHVMVLVAVGQLSLGEVIFVAAAGAIVQTAWRAQRAATHEQVLFNASAIAMGAGLAHLLCRTVLGPHLSDWLAVSLTLAAFILYSVNTLLVAAVLCLLNSQPLRTMWSHCHFWTFPYYTVGAAVAGLMVATTQTSGWMSPLLLLTVVAMLHVSYRAHVVPAAR